MTATAQQGRAPSQRALATLLGLSHVAVQRATKAGRIAQEPDGSWDVAKVRANLFASSDPARKTGQMAAASTAPPPAPSPAAARVPPQPTPRPVPIGAVAPVLGALDGAARAGSSTFNDARTANEVLKAQERRLRLDERKGTLVDKARAMMLVHRLAKEERDAILAWPSRVAAEMAAELGVDAHLLQTMMDARLREHLAERHDVKVQVT